MALPEDNKAHLAKDHRHFVYEGLVFAYQRGHEISNEFMRLEIQIAAVLFAFAAFFLGYIASVPNLWLRSAFAFALFSLIASIAIGLVHLKRKEHSWDNAAKERQLKFRKWQKAVDGGEGFDAAYAFDAGVSEAVREITSPPLWSWILQSACLGIGAAILLALALAFLFSETVA